MVPRAGAGEPGPAISNSQKKRNILRGAPTSKETIFKTMKNNKVVFNKIRVIRPRYTSYNTGIYFKISLETFLKTLHWNQFILELPNLNPPIS